MGIFHWELQSLKAVLRVCRQKNGGPTKWPDAFTQCKPLTACSRTRVLTDRMEQRHCDWLVERSKDLETDGQEERCND